MAAMFSTAFPQGGDEVRRPAVAGSFYPADPVELRSMVDECFAGAGESTSSAVVQAVIVPHAGYVFSGETAAKAFASISPSARYGRIFILGPNHRVALHGVSVDTSFRYYSTPLGKVEVDLETCEKLIASDSIFRSVPAVHIREHSLEVQLPFLQERLSHMPQIVPVVVGQLDAEEIVRTAKVLKPYLTQDNLFVISSDFSHYPSYKDACRVDKATGEAILSGSVEEFLDTLRSNARKHIPELHTSACGQFPIAVLMLMMHGRKDLVIRHLAYCNSGDSPYGDKEGVVGYHAFSVVYQEEDRTQDGFALSASDKSTLLEIARKSIETAFDNAPVSDAYPAEISDSLKLDCGAFVTLHIGGRLRGCIGNLVGSRPLYQTVADMARAAAFEDPRFRPLSRAELSEIHIEISVLSPLRRISSIDEFKLGRDGILMVKDGRSGTFLPQVAEETGWSAEEFFGHCARDKAGIGWDGWKDAQLYVYEAVVFDE